MTVNELIDDLKKYPSDMDVVVRSVCSGFYEYANYVEIKKDPTCGKNYYSEEERLNKLNNNKKDVVVIS